MEILKGQICAIQYLFTKHCGKVDGTPGVLDLSVGVLNSKLDELASSEDWNVKTGCLRWLIVRTSPKQMQWIVQIILKDVKVLNLLCNSTIQISFSSDCLSNMCFVMVYLRHAYLRPQLLGCIVHELSALFIDKFLFRRQD